MSASERIPDDRQDGRYHLIFLNAIPGRSLSDEVVGLHAAHLTQLDRDGKLALAGPIPERRGGLIVLRTRSLAEATSIAEEDPLIQGKFQTYEVATWLMSNRENDYRPTFQPDPDR
jgi:uncharacterized protein YciI